MLPANFLLPAPVALWERRTPTAMPVWQRLVDDLETRRTEATGTFHHTLRLTSPADFEALSNPETSPYDTVLAPGWLTVATHPPTLLKTMAATLRPGGLLLASTLGPGSFTEFRHAWAAAGEALGYGAMHQLRHVIPFADAPTWAATLQGLKLESPVVDVQTLVLTFSSFPKLYATLRAHGTGNCHPERTRCLTGQRLFATMEDAYRTQNPRPDGYLPLALEIITLHGFAPPPSSPLGAPRHVKITEAP